MRVNSSVAKNQALLSKAAAVSKTATGINFYSVKDKSKAHSKTINTVENILRNVHDSGYYVSALERLKRQKKYQQVKKFSNMNYDNYQMPPDPIPLKIGSFEILDIDEVKSIKKQQDRSDVSSGP